MASLQVTISESVSLNNQPIESTSTVNISSVTDVYRRIVTVPSGADTTIATFQTAVSTSDNAIDLESVKYIRVTNLDSTNPVNLSLQIAGGEGGTANMSTSILVEAGKSFMMGSVHDGIATADDAATLIDSLVDLESLLVDSLSQNVQVEVFIAS